MPNPTIISCAVTGGADTKSMNPAIPVSPKEIAAEALAAHDAGAAIVHVHVRDPDTGKATPDPEKMPDCLMRLPRRSEKPAAR